MSATELNAGVCIAPAGEAGRSVFEIWPHRSLDRRGTLAVLTGVAFGAVFILIRSPAALFCPLFVGALLPVGALALAFWCNNRAARFAETIEIGPDVVSVSRRGFKGGSETTFTTAWVRIQLSDDRYMANRLTLAESGRRRSVGEFLSPEERGALAVALRARIDEALRPHPV